MGQAPSKTANLSWEIQAGFFFAVFLVILFSIKPYAGGWNDGSRLASVEALVDYHTFAIDQSIFVQVPESLIESGYTPYESSNTTLLRTGTLDKLSIHGHFYTDKPMLISVLVAIPYQVWVWLGGPHFAERPDQVIWFLTLMTSGLAYALSSWWMLQITSFYSITPFWRILITSSFLVCTIALAYLEHINNHILLLAIFTGICYQLLYLREIRTARESIPIWRLCFLGTLAGISFHLDLGLGPILVPLLLFFLVYRYRKVSWVLITGTSIAPWLIAYAILNVSIGGVLTPLNSVPEYLAWSGSPFSSSNMTGLWQHSIPKLIVYGLDLLIGKNGFLGHNLILFFAVGVLCKMIYARAHFAAETLFALVWSILGWLMYTAMSNNAGGACASIRWFLPFLTTGFLLILDWLEKHPENRRHFVILSSWGLVIALLNAWLGPWRLRMIPLYWPLVAVGLTHWLVDAWIHQPVPAKEPNIQPIFRQSA